MVSLTSPPPNGLRVLVFFLLPGGLEARPGYYHIPLCRLLLLMYDIIKVIRLENGVQVVYDMKASIEEDHFLYSALIDQKINALDLIENPQDYGIDTKKHLIVPRK